MTARAPSRTRARVWRERASALLASGWAPEIAFDAAAEEASGGDCPTEATIQQMTLAAVDLHGDKEWPHASAFSQWWNARFADAPLVGDFRAPCFAEIGGARVGFIAPWRTFIRDWRREREQ